MKTSVSFKFKSVLIVDDNPVDAMICEKMLKREHFCRTIEKTASARDALEYLKLVWKEKGDEIPELIFLDVYMPGMDGFMFIEEFNKLPDSLTTRCKIVMLTAYDYTSDISRANTYKSITKFLYKPLKTEYLQSIS